MNLICPGCKGIKYPGFELCAPCAKLRAEAMDASNTVYRKDNVNHPDHYGGEDNPYEVIKVAEAQLTPEEFIGAMKFNIMKYNARHAKKNGLEDFKKAFWYQNRLVKYLEKQEAKKALNAVEDRQ